MDFTFSDVNSSFLNMVQQDLPREFKLNTNASESQNQTFLERLTKAIESAGHPESNSLPQTNSIQQTNPIRPAQDSEKVKTFLSEKLGQEAGTGFVSALKSVFLMLSNGDLKNLSIDADGLEALKKILLKAGFSQKEVCDLIAELSEELENKDLALSDFLDKLFDLPLEEKAKTDTDPENFLETSALPFFESILNSLGISRENIQEILNEADKGEKGVSLDVIIDKLQTLQKKSFYTRDHYQTKEEDNNFRLLLKQLNLDQGESKSSLTLDELVDSLEKLRAKMLQSQVAAVDSNAEEQKGVSSTSEKPLDLFNALFKGLELKDTAQKNQAFEFSYEQIKDQFKNGLLVPGEAEADKKEFSPLNKEVKNGTDAKLKEGFREMESFLDGKKSGSNDLSDPLKESKTVLKQMKDQAANLSDQGMVSNAKAGETPSNLDILKTKSSIRNLPTHVTSQVTKSLVRAVNQGENILKIQLKPPELGRLVMTIDNTGGSMKVSIMTEHHAAKEILVSNMNEIKTVLSQSGVNLEHFDVNMSSNFKQSMADARNQTGNSGKRNRNRDKLDPVTGEGINDSISHLNSFNQDGSLHFVA